MGEVVEGDWWVGLCILISQYSIYCIDSLERRLTLGLVGKRNDVTKKGGKKIKSMLQC